MSHHGREGEDDREELQRARAAANNLGGAVQLLTAIARQGFEPSRVHIQRAPHLMADEWLLNHGYDCPSQARMRKQARNVELNKQIDRLQAEQAQLAAELQRLEAERTQ